MLAELRAQGHDVGRKRVARLMTAAGLRGRRPPRWVRTTTPEPTPPAIPDLVHGQFTAPAPDVLWVGDITYIRTWEGWLYLATVIDVFSRRVIGFSLANHMRASLVCDALQMAVATRGGNVAGVIFHSDRGSQYTSAEFRALCETHGVKQSMGKTGVCWASRGSCAGGCSMRARRRRGLRGGAGEGRCPSGSTGAGARWCSRSSHAATGCAGHRSRSRARCRRELRVLSHLGPLVPGERPTELFGERPDHPGDLVADGLGAVTSERWPVLHPWLLTVAVHWWKVRGSIVNLVVRALTRVPNRGLVEPDDQVTFPVARYGPLGGSSAYRRALGMGPRGDELLAAAPRGARGTRSARPVRRQATSSRLSAPRP